MPIARVQVQDGRIMRLEVPEGTTPEQVESFVAEQMVAEGAPEPETGFIDGIKQDWQKRQQNVNRISADESRGMGISALQEAGQGFGFMGDVAGRGIGMVLPDILKEKLAQVAQSEPVQAVTGAYREIAPEGSSMDDTLSAIANIAGVAPIGAGIKALGKAGGVARKGINAASDAMAFAPKKAPKLTLSEKAAAAQNAVAQKYAAQENIRFVPEVEAKLVTSMNNLIPKSASSAAPYAESGALNIIKNLEKDVIDGNLDFQTLLDARSNLNGKKFSTTDSNQARILGEVKKKIDEAMISPETGTWIEANHDFGIAATKRDIGDMVKYAAAKAQPANSLDTKINNYLLEEGHLLSKSERKALEDITKNTYTDDIKRGMATRLMSLAGTGIGAAGGGPLGAVVGNVAGTIGSRLMRDLNFQKKYIALEKFFDQLDARPRPKIPEAPKPKPETQKLLPSPNSAQPMTSDQIKAAQKQINRTPKQPTGIARNPNLEGIKSTTVRNPDGTLQRANLMSLPHRNTEAYKNLTYIKQRFVDKVVQDYTGAKKSKAEVIRDMARRGQIRPQDANEILESLKEIKVWRKK